MSKFYLDSSHSNTSTSAPPSPAQHSRSNSDSDSFDITTLPYPQPLSRTDFLSPTFTPATYLSTLTSRHQTLEDLRSELRSRSQLLSKELLDLVNANYQEFLNLGNNLKGGEERVEEVRVGLLGFRREVEGVVGVVARREEEVGRSLEERREVRREIEVGRRLVEFEEQLGELEGDLGVEGGKEEHGGAGDDISDSEEEEDEEDEDEGSYGISIAKLKRNVVSYRSLKQLETTIGEHPFLTAQSYRLAKLRSTILLDLKTALQQPKSAGAASSGRIMKIMSIYADMEEPAEAIKVLKASKIA